MNNWNAPDGRSAGLEKQPVPFSFSNNASRAPKLGEDKVKISLQAGENVLMVEVINGTTDWGTAVRIVGADGKAIAGMKVVAK